MADRRDLDALGAGFVHDPHPWLSGVREAESVRRVVFHGMNAWLLTRYEDVRAAQTDPRLSAELANAPAEVRALSTETCHRRISAATSSQNCMVWARPRIFPKRTKEFGFCHVVPSIPARTQRIAS